MGIYGSERVDPADGRDQGVISCGFCGQTVVLDFWDSEWHQDSDGQHVCPTCFASGAWGKCESCGHVWPTGNMAVQDACADCYLEWKERGQA